MCEDTAGHEMSFACGVTGYCKYGLRRGFYIGPVHLYLHTQYCQLIKSYRNSCKTLREHKECRNSSILSELVAMHGL